MHRKTAIIILIPVIILTAAYFCGSIAVRNKIEHEIAQKLQSKIGPALSYRVAAYGNLFSILRGHLSALHIYGNDVTLPDGIIVDNLDISASDIVFNIKKAAIATAGHTDFAASVSPEKIKQYIKRTYPGMSEIEVTLADDRLKMHVCQPFAGVHFPVDIEGIVGISKGTMLVLDLKKFACSRIKMPGIARRTLESKFNPLLDTADWPFRTTLTSAAISDGIMKITGNVELY